MAKMAALSKMNTVETLQDDEANNSRQLTNNLMFSQKDVIEGGGSGTTVEVGRNTEAFGSESARQRARVRAPFTMGPSTGSTNAVGSGLQTARPQTREALFQKSI